jgi:hypothetical protein
MNINNDGDRVANPVVYDAVVKLNYFGGAPGRIGGSVWETHPAPPRVLRAVHAQLQAALKFVETKLAEADQG